MQTTTPCISKVARSQCRAHITCALDELVSSTFRERRRHKRPTLRPFVKQGLLRHTVHSHSCIDRCRDRSRAWTVSGGRVQGKLNLQCLVQRRCTTISYISTYRYSYMWAPPQKADTESVLSLTWLFATIGRIRHITTFCDTSFIKLGLHKVEAVASYKTVQRVHR